MEQAEVHEPAHVLDETHVLAWLIMWPLPLVYIVPSKAPIYTSRSPTPSRILHSSSNGNRSPNSTPLLNPSPIRI